MADTKLVICEKCRGTGYVNGGNENSTWSKTCEDCHGIGLLRVPTTNADRVRSMSDGELSVFLCEKFDCRSESCPGIELCKPNEGKANGLLRWLQQPAE